MGTRNLTIAMAICLAFSAVGARAQTADFDENWTTVGSDGTLDESSVGKVFFDNSRVQKGLVPVISGAAGKPAAAEPAAAKPILAGQTDSAVIRYNVTPVDSFFVPLRCEAGASGGIQLKLRYLAAGSGARVVAKLIEVDMATGTEAPPLLTFDSTSFGRSNSYQEHAASVCGRPWTFDFERKAYYIEATLTTSSIAANSAAGIQIIKIDNFVSP